jgi:hypothetical protein
VIEILREEMPHEQTCSQRLATEFAEVSKMAGAADGGD